MEEDPVLAYLEEVADQDESEDGASEEWDAARCQFCGCDQVYAQDDSDLLICTRCGATHYDDGEVAKPGIGYTLREEEA